MEWRGVLVSERWHVRMMCWKLDPAWTIYRNTDLGERVISCETDVE